MASFYANIISEIEKETDNTELLKAAKDISVYYRSSNKIDITSPDYNNPAYCCAYIYKYAALHTRMATKYFRKMSTKKEVKYILLRNKRIKICCLGGGSGMEIVGICKALTVSPSLHNKVSKVSVLDKFHGWEPIFNNVMSSLVSGRDEMLPETFLRNNLRKEFVQVDFQYPLSEKAKQVISQADIVCMIKHISEFSTEKYANISQVLGKLFKKDALIFYIDKSEKMSLETVDYISRSSNFKVVMRPLEGEKFTSQVSSSKVETYGSNPHTFAKVSVIGWIKTSTSSDAYYNESFSGSFSSLTDVGSIGTEIEVMDSDIGTEVMDCDIGTEVMDCDIGSQDKDSDIGSKVMDSHIVSESLYSDTGSEITYSDIGSEIMHSDIGNKVMLSNIGSEVINSDVKSKTVYLSGKTKDSIIKCELMDRDIINSDNHCDNISCNKYTQTEDYLFPNDGLKSETEVELAALMEAVADLVTVIERFTLKKNI